MIDKVKEAWFTINDDFQVRYLKDIGYIPYITVDHVLGKEWVAHFKDITVNALTLYQTHKGFDKIIMPSRCYSSLELAIACDKHLDREVLFHNPDTHIDIGNGIILTKEQFKKSVIEILDEINAGNNNFSRQDSDVD